MSLFTDWTFLGPFMTKGIILFILLGVIGYGIGKITFHEPRDDKE
jgi:hypothetical protein